MHDDVCCWSPRAHQPCTGGCHHTTAPRQEAHCFAMGASPSLYRGIRNSLEHVSGFATKSRGVAYTGYNITSNGEEGDEGEKRESYLFSPYYPLSLCICRCDLEPRSNRVLYIFPSIMYVCVYIYIYIYITHTLYHIISCHTILCYIPTRRSSQSTSTSAPFASDAMCSGILRRGRFPDGETANEETVNEECMNIAKRRQQGWKQNNFNVDITNTHERQESLLTRCVF